MSEMQGSVESGNPGGDVAAQGNVAPQGNWYDSYGDDVKGLAQVKGWKDPADVVSSYANLEKLLGADKAGRGLVLPKDDADPSEWGQVYDKLGRPQSADEYKLPVPEGDTGEFAKLAAGKFHELGLTAKQAEALAGWYNEQAGGIQAKQGEMMAQNAERELAELQQAWGKDYDANIEAGRRAARQFEVSEDMLTAIEGSIGTKAMLEMFSKIGKGLGEDSFVNGNQSNAFGMSPEAARVRIGQLKADKEWAGKYLSGNADARAEMERLLKSAYPQ